jgi:hypothetical protein
VKRPDEIELSKDVKSRLIVGRKDSSKPVKEGVRRSCFPKAVDRLVLVVLALENVRPLDI